MGISFQMQNDHAKEVKEQVADRVLVALDAAGMQAASLSKMELQKSPMRVDTGLLRNSITHAVAGRPAAIKGYHADGGSNRNKKTGKRISANKANAGTVKMGFYSGSAPAPSNPEQPFVLVGTNVEYAIYVHEGTRSMTANRFLANAMRTNAGEFEKIMAMVLSQ